MNKHIDRGFEQLYNGEYEEADREFRKADCRGGRSLVAFKGRSFEKAMNQACKCIKREENHFSRERSVALKVIKLSLEKVEPDGMNRPEVVLPEARDLVGNVSWGEVNANIMEFVEDRPPFSDLLEDEPAGRDLRDEKIGKAFELIKSGRLDRGFGLFADLSDGYRDDPFLSACWAVSPDCVVDAPSELGLEEFRSEVKRILRLSEEAPDAIRASVLGLCLFNIYIEWGDREDVLKEGERLLERSLECFERAGELGGEGDFLRSYRGLCYSLVGELGEAISLFEGVSEESGWYSLARGVAERSREELEEVLAVERTYDLLGRALEARVEGRARDELEYLEEIDPECFGEYIRGWRPEGSTRPGYGSIAERVAELKIDLDVEPDIETLKLAVESNPENGKITGYLVERGTKKLDDGDFEGATKYFEAVPEDHDDFQFLKSYGEALKGSGKYGMAAEVFGELGSEDPTLFSPSS
ncbi:hypothetical protein AKJ64_02645 [candidate division MSBL1 archaeon SCGC-AAA259E17]|uniref:Tetratricopeptide repeat protein n=1 Tax=candidate division MSBL1 archaeon SCGC-AAA259E17 TaxID=1698263 RepID=A0A133UEP6_9EURY|nr:hypothetical protein AKJ64_02645 [candidate division MSBL1 archaeon SCGC-AAA259E17]